MAVSFTSVIICIASVSVDFTKEAVGFCFKLVCFVFCLFLIGQSYQEQIANDTIITIVSVKGVALNLPYVKRLIGSYTLDKRR